MKRILSTLLVTVFFLGSISSADAKTHHRKQQKTTPEIEVQKTGSELIPVEGIKPEQKGRTAANDEEPVITRPGPQPFGPPVELSMKRADSSRIDLRALPQTAPPLMERPEREEPPIDRTAIQGLAVVPEPSAPVVPFVSAPAPAPLANFDGLDFANFGNGHPPDTNGDVGPTYYIQSINTSLGIFQKSDGLRVAAFSFNTFMSQGHFGNLCDTNNFGDPVILYDSFEDRWVVTDFAFKLDAGGNVVNPPGNFQCFAVSMTGDPVSGGWNFYSINTAGGLGDYPKFGIWPDGLYMTASMFNFAAGGAFQNPRVYALNKAQMYAGKPTVQVVTFNAPSADFTVLPANARLQSGTPPPGTPNFYLSTWEFTNALTIYKFHVDWSKPSTSTFTGPDVPVAATSWPNANVANAPSLGGNTLDVLQIRAMMQNQYTNLGGTESLWATHTVRRGNTAGFAAPRWYQVNVTGGIVNPSIPQAATWDPDGANVINRFMPSVAVDRAGDMALGYSTSSSTTKPAIKYAGRLAGDPINTLTQTEQVLIQGTGTQVGNCGTTCIRWGDYSAMSLDPDGCTFWYTNMYYAVDGLNHQTRIGSFSFPSCTPVGAGGTLSGTVTGAVGGAPLSGVTLSLGSRTTTTNASGVYSFTSVPAGTYPLLTASLAGYNNASATSVIVTDGNTTTQDFSLTLAAASACLVDTTQSDFQTGDPLTNVDINSSPGDVLLLRQVAIDQQNLTISTSGVGINATTWGGQTFTAGASKPLLKADINLFCSGCTGTTPNLTLSLRATAANLPTGPDLATATIAGFSSGAGGYFTGVFTVPPTLTAGTVYALVVRPTANPSAGTYALTRSATNVYAGGQRVSSADSGTTWTAPLTAGQTTDAGFDTFIDNGFVSGTFVSGLKDSNPALGLTPIWSTLSWTANTPANTSVQFQIAASNSDGGPFTFVGPDGTAATFFTTSGASLSQFYGFRYLKYKAFLATTDSTITPALNDVTICYSVADCSGPIVITPGAPLACANSTGNTATGPAGETSWSWLITNGTITGGQTSQTVTYTAGASGVVGLTLNVVEAGGCQKTGSTSVPIPGAPTIEPGGPTTFCAGGSVTLTSSSATGNQWFLDGNPIVGATAQQFIATLNGAYTVTGDGCAGPASAPTIVTVNPLPATPTITPGGPTTFCAGGSVTLTSSSATGNQWFLNGNPIGGATNQSFIATAAGDYTVTVTDGNGCTSLPSSATTVVVNPIPATPTITPGGPTTFCAGGSVTLTSSSATGNQWFLNGNPIGGATNQAFIATASGDYTVVVTATGCSSAPSAPTTVVVNPLPATPTITPGGPTTFCAGGSVTLTSSSATGNQWFLNGNPIGGATAQFITVNGSGNYTVVVTNGNGCVSAPSAPVTVTVIPLPPTPTITAAGPTTFCDGGSVTLTSSSATGNRWLLNGSPIEGTTGQSISVSVSGSYTVVVNVGGCDSNPSAPTTVTVNPIPAAPSITANGPTTFCPGGSVTLTSSSEAGNQWFLNGNPIGGATSPSFLASVAGDYSVNVTSSGCAGSTSLATTVTIDPNPSATITAAASVASGSTGNTATVANAGAGASYAWTITNGTITGGSGTPAITFTAGATGSLTINVTVTTAGGCSDTKSASTSVTTAPPVVTITSVVPASGPFFGGKPVTINGSGFHSGATVTLGGTAATNVTVVNATTITATTPAHAAGAVSVTVTNSDSTSASLSAGYTFKPQQFDPNGDSAVDPSDIFYLVNYLFLGGPIPRGAAGMPSGDANSDGLIDPADIFYTVNYLFNNGPQPLSDPSRRPVATSTGSPRLAGAISLGQPTMRNGHVVVPVIVSAAGLSDIPQALSLSLHFRGAVEPTIHRAGAASNLQPLFEISRQTGDTLSWLISFDPRAPLALGRDGSAVIADIELSRLAGSDLTINFDPKLTMLSSTGGMLTATEGNGMLQLHGITLDRIAPVRPQPQHDSKGANAE
jgi:hypothetical protein